MYAIMNYFNDPKLSGIVAAYKYDKVISNTDEFYLTKDKEYEIIEVNNPTMISIVNDIGEKEIYSVENFVSCKVIKN